MRRGLTGMVGVIVLLCWLATSWNQPALSAKEGSSSGGVLKGEVLILTDDFYLIKERNGKGVQVFVDKGTKRTGTIKVGDTVEAQVSGNGHALSIKLSK